MTPRALLGDPLRGVGEKIFFSHKRSRIKKRLEAGGVGDLSGWIALNASRKDKRLVR